MFADRTFRLLCPYDAVSLDATVVSDAETTHPYTHGGSGPNPAYRADALLDGTFDEALPPAPDGRIEMTFGHHDLGRLRRFVAREAARAGTIGPAADDLVQAVDEIAANAIIHGGVPGTARCWTDGPWFVCQIEGAGTFTDPLAGRRRPAPEATGGRGLWLANQLCDLVQLRNTTTGTLVRLRSRRHPD